MPTGAPEAKLQPLEGALPLNLPQFFFLRKLRLRILTQFCDVKVIALQRTCTREATVARRTCFGTTLYGAYWVRMKVTRFIH